MPKVDKKIARKRKSQRARTEHRRRSDAEKRRLRLAPLAETWSDSEFVDGNASERLKKVSMKTVLARFEADNPALVNELRPILIHRGRPPRSEMCKTLTTALTLAAWEEYADLPDFAPMVSIDQQKNIRVGHVNTEEDAVGHGMCVRYDDYNPVLFLAKTGKVGAVSYRRETLNEMVRFLGQDDSRKSALLLDMTRGESTIRKEVILDGDLAPEQDVSVLLKGPEKNVWDPAPFRALVADVARAAEVMEVPRPVVKWRVERRDNYKELLTNSDGGWKPFDTREDAEAALPDDSWYALETPVITKEVDSPKASRARLAVKGFLIDAVNLGPCAALEKVEAAAKALDGSKEAWGTGAEKEAFEAVEKLLEDAKGAATGRPSTSSVAVWLATGMKEQDGSRVYAKVGYLPLWMHEEKAYVVAEAFLPCGTNGTPEHGLSGMETMAEDATLANLVAAYGSRDTVMTLVERGLEPLIAVKDGRGERPTFVPLSGFVTSTEDRLYGV